MRSSPFSLPSCVIQIKALASIYPNILRGSAAAIYLGSKCCVWQRCLISRRCLIGARERGPDRRHSRAPRPAPRGDKYARQFLIGGGVTLINITIHALMMTTVVRVAQVAGTRKVLHPSFFSHSGHDPDRIGANDYPCD